MKQKKSRKDSLMGKSLADKETGELKVVALILSLGLQEMSCRTENQ